MRRAGSKRSQCARNWGKNGEIVVTMARERWVGGVGARQQRRAQVEAEEECKSGQATLFSPGDGDNNNGDNDNGGDGTT
ncbi:hypothetical protein E0Z10_g7607 [Xylaria hypoxylon]|uniref:Uncharacterized protein n=1 Tax=Xylaria hypoxylon TaxID=37992 RepID=A0A4Z0YAA6_9PEZI|nr:hypothetical protein E0Z10_g7607 [Xylaria hypoxylon]